MPTITKGLTTPTGSDPANVPQSFVDFVSGGTTPIFANTGARDSQWPTPPNGALCVTIDTYTLWLRRAAAWVPAQAQGLLEEYTHAAAQLVGGGTSVQVWGGGTLSRPVYPAKTALVNVTFNAAQITAGKPGVLGVEAIMSGVKKQLGGVSTQDTNLTLGVTELFAGTGVFPIPSTSSPVSDLVVNVYNIAPAANDVNILGLVIDVVEV